MNLEDNYNKYRLETYKRWYEEAEKGDLSYDVWLLKTAIDGLEKSLKNELS